MGRASNRKTQRKNTTNVDTIEDLDRALRALNLAVARTLTAARKVEDAYMIDVSQDALNAAAVSTGEVDFFVSELRQAAALIDADVPVSPDGIKGYRWEPPLSMSKLFLYIEAAGDEDPGYREAARRNKAFAVERQQKIEAAQSQTCTACRRRPVYLPIDDAATECYGHIAGDELKRVELIWDRAIDLLPCPGCNKPAGAMCTENESQLVLVDGRWPRIRKFQGRVVHKERLDLSVTIGE